jgi:hypothetical protein
MNYGSSRRVQQAPGDLSCIPSCRLCVTKLLSSLHLGNETASARWSWRPSSWARACSSSSRSRWGHEKRSLHVLTLLPWSRWGGMKTQPAESLLCQSVAVLWPSTWRESALSISCSASAIRPLNSLLLVSVTCTLQIHCIILVRYVKTTWFTAPRSVRSAKMWNWIEREKSWLST